MVTDTPDGAVFSVWAKPRASKSRVLGRRAGPDGRDSLEVALAAPPVEGAANLELVELVARALGVSQSRIEIVAGDGSRLKRVRVRGARADEVVKAFGL
jgi:uncharacterized protein